MPDTHQIHTCPNCGSDPKNGRYCPNCGQKNKPTKLNLGTIFGELFSILFNLDNQFFRTIKVALIPGKLATEFGKGKRKTYLHPLRFFFYSWVLFALLLNFSFGADSNNFANSVNKLNLNDSTKVTINQHTIDSLKGKIKDKDFYVYSLFGSKIHFISDTAKLLPPSDTLKTILYSDFNNLSQDSLFHKYSITGWADKFIINRTKRIDKGFGDIFKYMLDHFIWLFFAVAPFSALWLWLLFGRSKKYYAEHVLYLLYLFGMLFLFFSTVIVASYLPGAAANISILILWLLLILYSYFSLKNYYGQGGFKTFVKWNAYLLFNLVLFIIFTVFFSIISAALF